MEKYNHKHPSDIPPVTNVKIEDDSKTMVHFCTNWGCEHEFTPLENADGLNCLCHPGYWDFGHCGIFLNLNKNFRTNCCTGL